jgi:hypothetical protein
MFGFFRLESSATAILIFRERLSGSVCSEHRGSRIVPNRIYHGRLLSVPADHHPSICKNKIDYRQKAGAASGDTQITVFSFAYNALLALGLVLRALGTWV